MGQGQSIHFSGVAILLCLTVSPGRAQSPEQAVAAFCERDGYGDRLKASTWRSIAELVRWSVEPAWDHVFLISGYEVRGARAEADEVVVRVRYTVVAEVSGLGVLERAAEQIVDLRLARAAAGWSIVGPPPAPRVFDSIANRDEMAQSLTPDAPQYLSNSKLIWQMFTGAGWTLAYTLTGRFLASEDFIPVAEPRFGDVVAYLHGSVPYHVGIYRGEGRVVSATVTDGPVRTNLNAFPGEVRYLRLQRAENTPVPTAGSAETGGGGVPAPTAAASPQSAATLEPAAGAVIP